MRLRLGIWEKIQNLLSGKSLNLEFVSDRPNILSCRRRFVYKVSGVIWGLKNVEDY